MKQLRPSRLVGTN